MRVLVTKLQKVERVAFAPEGTHLFASGLQVGSPVYGATDTGIDVFDLATGVEPVAHLFTGRDIEWFTPLPGGRLLTVHWLETEEGGLDEGTVSIFDWRAGHDTRFALNEWEVRCPCGVSSDGSRLITGL